MNELAEGRAPEGDAPESFDAKMSSYVKHEQLRLPSIDIDKARRLAIENARIFNAVPTPPGASSIEAPRGLG